MLRSRWTHKDVRLPADLCERLGQRFERGVFEAALSVEPDNVEALVALGAIYTKEGRFERGLEVDLRLVRMRPRESLFHYNLACSHSLLGHLDPAFAALQRAVQLGYDNSEHLEGDVDLANLRGDVRYTEILRRIRTLQSNSP